MSIYVKRVSDCKLIMYNGLRMDVSSYRVSYSLNSIPTATVRIPLGREFNTEGISNGFLMLTNTFVDQPCYLVFSVRDASEGFGLNPYISNGTYVLFAGYPTGVAFVKTSESIQLEVTLRHWLSDLDFASAMSSSSHPSNPKNLIYNPKLQFGGAGSGLNYALAGLVQNVINPYYAAEGFWSNALFPFLASLVRADRINNVGGTGNDCLNFAVMRALSSWRFSYLPLNIANLGIIGVSKFIDSFVGLLDLQSAEKHLDSLAGTTIWKKLLEYASQYMFTIIPFPMYYRVEPVVLGLSNFYKAIPSSEILALTANLDRPSVPTRAIGVYSEMTPLAGSAIDNAQEAKTNLIGGWYIGSTGYGLVEVVQAPPCLDGPYNPAYFTRAAVGGINKKTPLLRSPAIRDLGVLELQRNSALAHFNVLDTLAHYYYITKQLVHRKATVVCPFRMDICPGSTVRLDIVSSESIPFESGYLFGTVADVTYIMDPGNSPKSIYNIIGVRNPVEFNSWDFSTTYHPFYGVYFIGGGHT